LSQETPTPVLSILPAGSKVVGAFTRSSGLNGASSGLLPAVAIRTLTPQRGASIRRYPSPHTTGIKPVTDMTPWFQTLMWFCWRKVVSAAGIEPA